MRINKKAPWYTERDLGGKKSDAVDRKLGYCYGCKHTEFEVCGEARPVVTITCSKPERIPYGLSLNKPCAYHESPEATPPKKETKPKVDYWYCRTCDLRLKEDNWNNIFTHKSVCPVCDSDLELNGTIV